MFLRQTDRYLSSREASIVLSLRFDSLVIFHVARYNRLVAI